MARVTVEDCVDKVHDRFELVALAAHRAKSVSAGAPLTIDRNDEKNTVLALREIGEQTISVDDLRVSLTTSYQRERDIDDDLEDDLDAASYKNNSPIIEISEEQLLELEAEGGISEPIGEEEAEKLATDLAAGEDSLSFAEDNLDIDD